MTGRTLTIPLRPGSPAMQRTTSVYLDLLRFLAAAVVFAGHAYPQRLTGGVPALWRFWGFGNDAVMVFFVLSGFVIAYVADQKERTLKSYSISRFARLYSVAVPAIVLTVVADAIGSRLAPVLYSAHWFATDNPSWRIAANLLFVNELWFTSVRPFSNVPFWSLGYEFWYYAIFAVAMYLGSWQRLVALVMIALVVGPKILLLLPVWLLGVWAYHCTGRRRSCPRRPVARSPWARWAATPRSICSTRPSCWKASLQSGWAWRLSIGSTSRRPFSAAT